MVVGPVSTGGGRPNNDCPPGASGGSALLHGPRGTAGAQEIEKRQWWQRLGPQDPDARPLTGGNEFEGQDRVDSCLPHHRLGAVLRHAPVVVDHVMEVDLSR
jgi:hypothetical protein